jgi:uncharacterized membrane protein
VYHKNLSSITTASIEGATISAALALIEHIALWEDQDRIPLVVRYTIGTVAILLGFTHTARRMGRLDLALALWGIACAAGAVVASAHATRHSQPDELDLLLEGGDANAVWLPSARRAR